MKLVKYAIFCVLVLVVSVLMRRPAEKTNKESSLSNPPREAVTAETREKTSANVTDEEDGEGGKEDAEAEDGWEDDEDEDHDPEDDEDE
jgi:hypothetical protein